MHLLPSDNFQVSTANNIEHYECKFTIHLPVGKRVALRIVKLKNETLETVEVSCASASAVLCWIVNFDQIPNSAIQSKQII